MLDSQGLQAVKLERIPSQASFPSLCASLQGSGARWERVGGIFNSMFIGAGVRNHVSHRSMAAAA